MNEITRRALACAVPAAAALAAGAAADEARAQGIMPSFEWTWRAHTDAVRARDLPALERTLTSGQDLILILPNGALTRTKAEYINFHRQWFALTTWSIEFEELWSQVSVSMGQILFRTRYTDVNDDGSSYETRNHLLMTFRREGVRWKLITDQNTRMPAA